MVEAEDEGGSRRVRLAILGVIYGAAVLFAVVCSPSVGLLTVPGNGHGHIAAR